LPDQEAIIYAPSKVVEDASSAFGGSATQSKFGSGNQIGNQVSVNQKQADVKPVG
jgi:hypothetical protein